MANITYQVEYFFPSYTPAPGSQLNINVVLADATGTSNIYPVADNTERTASELLLKSDVEAILANGTCTATIDFDGVDLLTVTISITTDSATKYPSELIDGSLGASLGFNFTEVATPAELTICEECRDVTLQACVDTYKIVAGLTAATEYYVAIEDRNGDIYTQAITSDSSGDLTIDATAPEFPVGFWLSESGNKVVKVYADADLTELQDITVGTTVYTCVQLNLQYRYTTTTSITPDFNYMVDDTFDFYIDNNTNSYILS